ncbi:MAG TPA: Gldg family protein [Candidatus Acidoferrales bacterium]|nr:Gldg family protein [Candidatus Acidoferrales bacterium]
MKINRKELFKSISYAGLAMAVAGYLRSSIEETLSPLDMGLLIAGGALLVLAAAFNLGALKAFFTKRSSRLGANTIVGSVAVLAILSAANVLAFRHDKRLDMTTEKLYSLSDQSKRIAAGLNRDVDFLYFSKDASTRLDELMAEYRTINRRIRFQRVDPVAQLPLARQYNVRQMGEMVATSNNHTVHLQDTQEQDITNALLQLTHDTVKTVCFVTGHGEKSIDDSGNDGYSAVKDALTKETYQTKAVNLVTADGVPPECTVLVIPGPTKALFPQEAAMVGKYLANGGKLFALVDPDTDSGLDSVFQAWNVKVGDNTVIDASGVGRLFGTGPAVPLVHDYGDSPITQGLQGTMTFYPLARTVEVADKSKTDPVDIELLKTLSASWATPKITGTTVSFDPKKDTRGPLSLGVSADRKEGSKDARLVAIGNSLFATNHWERLQGNGDLFLNAISWLAQDQDLISIRPKNPTSRQVTMTESQQRMLTWLSLGILPGLVVIAGIGIWWRRR